MEYYLEYLDEILEKFNQKYQIQGDCWIWIGGVKTRKGLSLPRFQFKDFDIQARKFAVTVQNKKVPENPLETSCGNRLCVNPLHLKEFTKFVTVFSPMERFFEKVNIAAPEECWEWLAGKNPKGYGIFSFDGRSRGAHVFSWELHNNQKVPLGLEVMHSCDNPSCVNPLHLLVGTHLENLKDKVKKNRQARGEKSGRAKLTEVEVLAIRNEWLSGCFTKLELAEKYGVNRQCIVKIVFNQRWKHI